MSDFLFVLPFIVLSILWTHRKEIISYITNAKATRLHDYVTYDEEEKTLCVYACHPDIAKLLKIRAHGIEVVGHQPDTYTYRSMQIGKVSTGRVSKTPGFDYVAGSVDSGKCELLFAGKPVHKIILVDPDLEAYARTTDIAQYMYANGDIQVYQRSKVSQSSLLMARSYETVQLAMSEAYPTKAKCKAILNFICYDGYLFSNQQV